MPGARDWRLRSARWARWAPLVRGVVAADGKPAHRHPRVHAPVRSAIASRSFRPSFLLDMSSGCTVRHMRLIWEPLVTPESDLAGVLLMIATCIDAAGILGARG